MNRRTAQKKHRADSPMAGYRRLVDLEDHEMRLSAPLFAALRSRAVWWRESLPHVQGRVVLRIFVKRRDLQIAQAVLEAVRRTQDAGNPPRIIEA